MVAGVERGFRERHGFERDVPRLREDLPDLGGQAVPRLDGHFRSVTAPEMSRACRTDPVPVAVLPCGTGVPRKRQAQPQRHFCAEPQPTLPGRGSLACVIPDPRAVGCN